MVTHPSILLIEDSPGECELFRLALVQTGIDVVLYTEHDADAGLHFLNDRYHQSSIQTCSYPLQESSLNRSPTARVQRGESATSRCASTGERSGLPSLILLDLKLGRRNGCDFLIRVRADVRFATIPVVVFTTSDDQTDLAICYASGANGYIVKPGTFAELLQCVSDICRYWIDRNRTPYIVGTKC
jgi:two-component system, chemotaxis family, response regulator Rcp1